MADKLVTSKDDTSVIEKYVDNGDGSWSRKIAVGGAAAGAAGFPAGATPFNLSASSANAVTNVNIPAVAGKTAYLTGIQVSGNSPTTAGAGALIITGLLGGASMIHRFNLPAAASAPGVDPKAIAFNPPVPASGPNVAISTQMLAFGAGSIAQEHSIQGFYL